MKITMRLATEQYCYVEVETDVVREAESIKEMYDELSDAFKPKEGITEKEMNKVLDTMLNGESVQDGVEIYQRMSSEQKTVCQHLKRALARIKSRENKPVIEE